MTSTFVVDRKQLKNARWSRTQRAPLGEGSVLMAIDLFALTSNNITYAAFGETMNYWSFFPTGDAETGCIPVWGFANVIESRCEGVVAGERFYGYYPIATDVVVQPSRVDSSGFVDGSEHRRELHAVYNKYSRCSADPAYVSAREAEQALLRPLFGTSFLINDFLVDNDFFGATSVILSSASSKTAYGTAFCIGHRGIAGLDGAGNGVQGAGDKSVKIIGLTSPGNMAFTRGLGCYDQVEPYDAVKALSSAEPVVYVDFSGSAVLRADLHEHMGDSLRYSCSVGGTHWDSLGGAKGLSGPRPVLFFAPAQMKKRIADWGAEKLTRRIAASWEAFMRPVTDSQSPWLRVIRGQGEAAVEAVYASLLAGTVSATEGHVLCVAPADVRREVQA